MTVQNIDIITGTYTCAGEVLDQLTKLSGRDRDTLFHWFLRQGEATRVEAIRLQGSLLANHNNRLRQLGQKQDPATVAETRYAYLVLALSHMRHAELQLKQKVSVEKAEQIAMHRVARVKALRKKKRAPQREKLRSQYFYLVKRLREKNQLSWRDVETYMRMHHHMTWSHSWIRKTFEAVKAEIEKGGGN